MDPTPLLAEGPLYPLRFSPRLVEKPWGGFTLQSAPDAAPEGVHTDSREARIGEKWLLSPLVIHPTPVANGPWQGMLLSDIMAQRGREILGESHSQGDMFPLLVKLIDAGENLSVQVHPDDAYARVHGMPGGKSEMWVVLRAKESAKLYLGWREPMTPERVQDMLRQGTLTKGLRSWVSHPGESHHVPAGTVHAIGAGQLLLEIQQPSDTTYRLYDWDRGSGCNAPQGRNGHEAPPRKNCGRELHIAQALASMRFDAQGERAPQSDTDIPGVSLLVEDPHFSVLRIEGREETIPLDRIGDRRPLVLFSGAGLWSIEYPDSPTRELLRPHELMLLPAALRGVTVQWHPGETTKGEQKDERGWLIVSKPH